MSYLHFTVSINMFQREPLLLSSWVGLEVLMRNGDLTKLSVPMETRLTQVEVESKEVTWTPKAALFTEEWAAVTSYYHTES